MPDLMQPNLLELFFWCSFALLIYTLVGYPALLGLLSRVRPTQTETPSKNNSPTITIVVTAYNEQSRITARLENLLAANYPPQKIDIIVVSDGSFDSTAANVRAFPDSRIQLLELTQRSGKAQCLNHALSLARGELVVFADARQRFASDTIAQLAQHFSDPKIGAVSGALQIEAADTSVGGGIDAYWRFEKFIREAESKFDSTIGCTGAVYAIRRELFRNLPADTLLDDVVIPMQIALLGYRVLFDAEAIAFDPQSLEPEREKIRKQRTLAGNYQMLFRYPEWLLPWRNRLWWQLLSHKYLRLAGPFFLVSMLIANAALISFPLYRLFLWAQLAFYFFAALGLVFRQQKFRCFALPAGFVFLNYTVLRGLWHYFRQAPQPGWQTAPPKETASHV